MTPVDKRIWARTIAGEARGENYVGQIAVGFVMLNRAKISEKSIAYECMKKYQFSCWNADDPNRKIIVGMVEAQLIPFLHVVDDICFSAVDITNGATFYHTKNILPVWTHNQKPCANVGRHIFYNNIAPYLIKK